MADVRVGIGFDAHALEDGVPLVLGGVELDHPRGLAGHSDGDVLLHAITDALLGSIAAGDHVQRLGNAPVSAASLLDRLGFTGRGEGLAAHAVALLERR